MLSTPKKDPALPSITCPSPAPAVNPPTRYRSLVLNSPAIVKVDKSDGFKSLKNGVPVNLAFAVLARRPVGTSISYSNNGPFVVVFCKNSCDELAKLSLRKGVDSLTRPTTFKSFFEIPGKIDKSGKKEVSGSCSPTQPAV